MCIVIVCYPVCDVINFEIYLSFLIKSFFFSLRMAAWLLLTFFIRLHNQLSSVHSIVTGIKEDKCLKNLIHQIDSKHEWFLLSVSFTAMFGLVLVLTLENAFS